MLWAALTRVASWIFFLLPLNLFFIRKQFPSIFLTHSAGWMLITCLPKVQFKYLIKAWLKSKSHSKFHDFYVGIQILFFLKKQQTSHFENPYEFWAPTKSSFRLISTFPKTFKSYNSHDDRVLILDENLSSFAGARCTQSNWLPAANMTGIEKTEYLSLRVQNPGVQNPGVTCPKYWDSVE